MSDQQGRGFEKGLEDAVDEVRNETLFRVLNPDRLSEAAMELALEMEWITELRPDELWWDLRKIGVW